MHKIRIAIADDYPVFRDGLKITLEADDNLEVVAEAGNGKELLQGISTTSPDIVLIDLNMPVLNGFETTRLLKEQHPAIKVIIISMYEDEKFVTHMKEAGADGYLLKNAEPEDIRGMIHNVYNSSRP